MSDTDTFALAVDEHDRLIRESGMAIWVGTEPTFTDRFSSDPQWTTEPLGGDKLPRAMLLLRELAGLFSCSVVLRTVGRQYPGEPCPRWSLGLYRRRDGGMLWNGPPDPGIYAGSVGGSVDLGRFSALLQASLAELGAAVWALPKESAAERRIVLCWDAGRAPDLTDPRLRRPALHSRVLPADGLQDELAAAGLLLFRIASEEEANGTTATVELPRFGDVATFLPVLQAIGHSAKSAGLSTLQLQGFPPPIDHTVEWATITPDPAVIEINMAPDASASEFLRRSRAVYRCAEGLGLSPYRLYYNGAVADSGGGGQITLGGPSPGSSPFFLQQSLLPRLVRYFNRHPSLSYLFAHDSIGSSGQSVRPDERGDDAFRELNLALELLSREEAPTPEILWRSLAPFLTDPSGNSHRAELNVEKLWNPFLPGRGQLGLLEFRAFRMQHDPERAAALVCLLRAISAMLSRLEFNLSLTDWGAALHERYALPFYLERDLEVVLQDLARAGFPLMPPIRDALFRDEFRDLAEARFEAFGLRLRRGLEFWPLVGDTSSQEQGASRLVDSSTHRVQLSLAPMPGFEDVFGGCRVWVEGFELPLRDERDQGRPVKVFGVRYRSFIPWQGLHPTLPATPTIRFRLVHPAMRDASEFIWHEWRPHGGPYDGLPLDVNDARGRRSERLQVRSLPAEEKPLSRNAPADALSAWSLDLRWLDSPGAD